VIYWTFLNNLSRMLVILLSMVSNYPLMRSWFRGWSKLTITWDMKIL